MEIGNPPQEMYIVFIVHIISIFSFHLVYKTFISQCLSPKETDFSEGILRLGNLNLRGKVN